MLDNLKNHIPLLEILVGYSIYLYFIIEASFAMALLSLILFVYLWLFTSLYLEQFKFHSFVYLICATGIITSVTLFFIIGVEEIPFPEGALVFHIEGITKALVLFFIFTIPLILIHKSKNQRQNSRNHRTENTEALSNDDIWEEASDTDLESGNFEII